MISIPLTPLTMPLVLAIWAIDTALFLIVARSVLGRSRPVSSTQGYRSLRQLTDPMPRFIERLLPGSSWPTLDRRVQWFLLGLLLCVARYALMFCMTAVS